MAGSVRSFNIASWNGSLWSTMQGGVDDQVNCLAVSGSRLFVGGYMNYANGLLVYKVALWDGTTWSALGSGVDSIVLTAAATSDAIYVGGYFSNAGVVPCSGICKWDGTAWSSLGTPAGMSGTVNAVAILGGVLFSGGFFHAAGDASTNVVGLAQQNGQVWTSDVFNLNPSSFVYWFVTCPTSLIAGGYILSNSGDTFSVGLWNGTTFSHVQPDVGTATFCTQNVLLGSDQVWNGTSYSYTVKSSNGTSATTLGIGMNDAVTCTTSCASGFTGSTCSVCASGFGGPNCTTCPANTYSDSTMSSGCVACPTNSISPSASPNLASCLCVVGYTGQANSSCAGSVCGENLRGVALGSTGLTFFYNPFFDSLLFFLIACALGTFKDVAGNSPCMSCPANATTISVASSSLASCVCGPGYTGADSASCSGRRP